MDIFVSFATFALGAIMGSFLNVLVLRLGTGLGIGKRSFCFSCSRQLSWYELIPLVSFALLRGKCASCKSAISFRYPLVELVTGLSFFFLFSKTGVTFLGAYVAVLLFVLLAIAVYDIHHKIIPDQFVYLFAALSFFSVLNFENWNLFGNWKLEIGNLISVENLLAGPLLFLPFAFLWVMSRGRYMGLGDAKLALGIGWALGLSSGFAALLIAFWLGALCGIVLVACTHILHLFGKKKGLTMKSEIPFAPFLVMGTFLAFYFDIALSDIQTFLTFSSLALF